VAKMMNFEPGHIVIAGSILSIILIIIGVASNFLVTILGFVYPAYMSFKALESDDEGDDCQWLTYWIIFSVFRIIDGLGGIVLGFIPFYHPIKLIFLVYLYHPRWRGANLVYLKLIRPVFVKYEKQLDKKIEELNPLSENNSTKKLD
jgi:receptor expression-enhancing protein 5/6